MLDMFADLDKLGKQVTVFLNEARETLGILKTEVSALREENRQLQEQVTRIEGAHHMLMNWLADIEGGESEESEEVEEAVEAAETAEAAAEVAVAAAEEITQTELVEETPVTEPSSQGENAPPAGEIPVVPAVLPVTPVVPAGEENPAPATVESESKKKQRRWI